MNLSEEQIHRYSRHIILPEVGGKGQKKLLASRVLLFGLTGPGSSAALYLAAAGVGVLGLSERCGMKLREEDIAQSMLFDFSGIGCSVLELTVGVLKDMNPDVRAEVHPLGTECWAELASAAAGYQVSVVFARGSEDWQKAAGLAVTGNCPVVAVGTDGLRGAATVFTSRSSLRPEWVDRLPSAGSSAAPVAGAVGALAATETVKLLLGIGRPLEGRLLILDGETGEFGEIPSVT